MNIRTESIQSNDSFNANSKIQVSFLKNVKDCNKLSLKNKRAEELLDEILSETIRVVNEDETKAKNSLPLLDLIEFGDKPSYNKVGKPASYRNDANILAYTGLELDYDEGTITYQQALDKLKASGLGGIIYSTPSFIAAPQNAGKEKSRWRILVFFKHKRELSDSTRLNFIELVTQKLGIDMHVFDECIKAKSQSYYYGHFAHRECRGEIVSGAWLDDFESELQVLLDFDAEFGSVPEPEPEPEPDNSLGRYPLNKNTERFVKDALKRITPLCSYRDDTDDTDDKGWLKISCAIYHMSTQKDGDEALGKKVWLDWSQGKIFLVGKDDWSKANVTPITDDRKWQDLHRGDGLKKAGWTLISQVAKTEDQSFDAEAIRNALTKADAEDLMQEVETDDFDEEFAHAAEKPWTDKLQRNSAGNRNLKPAMGNVDLILRNDKAFAGCFAFNEFTNEFCIVKTTSLFKKGDAFDDDIIVAKIKTHCSSNPKYRVDFKNTDIALKVAEIAKENKFHPVQDYLNSLVWDGTPRIDELFVKYCGCKNDSYHREAARLWLVAAVARVFEAGHKFDYCPVLSGKQGIGKSSFARILAKDWFVELQDDLKDKKAALEKTEGAWIVELSELASLNHRNVNHVKGFLTDTDNKYRKAYARRAQNNPIQCVYFGSTNENSYLIDKTGNRRFWPVAVNVEQIDLARLAAERDSLWAEALHEYKKMRDEQPSGSLPLFLGKEANATAIELQEGARIESDADVIADAIIAYFSAEEGFDNPMPESINTVWVWCNILNLTGQPAGKARRDVLDALDKLVGLGKIAKRDRLKRHPVLM